MKKKKKKELKAQRALDAVRAAATAFNGAQASIVTRDAEGKILSVGVYAEGEAAVSLAQWLDAERKTA